MVEKLFAEGVQNIPNHDEGISIFKTVYPTFCGKSICAAPGMEVDELSCCKDGGFDFMLSLFLYVRLISHFVQCNMVSCTGVPKGSFIGLLIFSLRSS